MIGAAAGRPRVLVVDDYPAMRHILVELLAALGFEDVTEVDDGRTALAELQGGRYELLVANCDMPGLAGVDLVNAVRAYERLRSVAPLLLVAGEAQRERIGQALGVGTSGCIVKPFTAETLRDELERIFERTRCAA